MGARRGFVGGLVLALVALPLTVLVLAEEGPKSETPKKEAADPSAPGSAPGAASAADQPGSDQPAAGNSREDGLSSVQEIISRRFKRFEDTLYKIAEAQRRTDPERADLLIRAIGKSKEERISQQMADLIQLLRENKQLGDAIERQEDLVTHLHSLLDLLLSEDRQKELKEEQARIKKYIEEVNKIIAKEKANRADTERGAPTDEIAGMQKKIADQAGNLGKQMAKDDEAKQARAKDKGDGKKSGDKSADGKPDDGKSDEEKSGDKSGDDKSGDRDKQDGKSDDGKSDGKKPEDGKPAADKPSDKPGAGKSDEGKPNDAKPGDNKPSDGKPSDGKSSEGQPSPGKPSEGNPAEGQPGESQPSPGGDEQQQPQQTPGREELEKAKRDMERAIEQLKKQQRHAASDAQDDAIANLQKAKEKLEEILKQLREEERERFLAMLEARFQRMLAMQLVVYDGTVKLDKTPADDRSARHSARSLQLARQEEEIAIEATKAITLLRDEGTAVAFPEAVEQMRDDMRIVVSRLERTEIGELTQGIEREIIDALEEMIDALQKEIEKGKDKKKQEPPKDGQQPQEPQLVDQLAELKMLRTLQLRINHRTKRLGRMVEGEQALEADILGQLQNLAERQARIQKATYDMATGRNK